MTTGNVTAIAMEETVCSARLLLPVLVVMTLHPEM